MERHKKNAVVLIDCGFLCLDVRDNDRSVYKHASAQFERIACPVAL